MAGASTNVTQTCRRSPVSQSRRQLAAMFAISLCGLLLVATPSQALVVKGSRTTDVSFAGISCGDRDEEVLTLPRRAHAIRVLEPSVGDTLVDDDGQPVADVTDVHKQGHQVLVTARGAHDVCNAPG